MKPVDVIVLAGRREGQIDPLAAHLGETEKCLVPVAGRPLIEHVLSTLAESPAVGVIAISVNDPEVLRPLPLIQHLMKQNRLVLLPSHGNLADSVVDAAANLRFPMVVTTADNALFTQEALDHFIDASLKDKADAAAAFARRASVLLAHAEGQRRFYTMADDAYSNCNCYWIGSASALSAVEVFRTGGQFRKNPMRIAQMFGFTNLIAMRLGLFSLSASFRQISKKLALNVVPIVFEDGALAIDVDNVRSHKIVEHIIMTRAHQKIAA
jgi:GTP:adenosylcobinamide-phosphate guanylyltransferase